MKFKRTLCGLVAGLALYTGQPNSLFALENEPMIPKAERMQTDEERRALLKKDLILVKRGVLDFYPELIEFPNINERLSLYSLKFYIDMLILGKHKEESKTRIQEILNGKVYFEV